MEFPCCCCVCMPGCTRLVGIAALLCANIAAGPNPDEALGLFPSNAGGGPMVLDTELRPISDGVSGPL